VVALVEGVEERGRPKLRVNDIFRRHGEGFGADHVLTPGQHKVLRALIACRTAALGGHLEFCDACGFQRPAYNSCRNRHCPGCQAAASHEWLEQRLVRVLPTHHFHVVFTLPEELRPLALRNGAVVYDILLRAAAEALDVLGRQRLGARLGVTSVLHTWTRAMLFHPHVHCVVTGGGLALDGSKWVPTPRGFLLPVAVLRKLFRGIVRRQLRVAYDAGKLDLGGECAALAEPKVFARLLRSLFRKRWVVYSKPPFAGADRVFEYLGRYTHRVAISDHRLLALTDDAVTIRTKHGQQATIAPAEFIRRFLLHVLPGGFHKIRHTGLYAAANVHTKLVRAAEVLGGVRPQPPAKPEPVDDGDEPGPVAAASRTCPCCKVGTLVRIDVPRPQRRSAPPAPRLDSS
jgi:hypothetical protein